jgi:TPP-dependent 2-oxoacid decarboxylase
MAATISMGQYLFRRIQSIGVDHILGVPGDFNRELFVLIFASMSPLNYSLWEVRYPKMLISVNHTS